MNIPDLQAQLGYWAPLLKLQAHDITMQYVPDLRAPASREELETFLTGRMGVEGFTGPWVWGLNIGQPESADIHSPTPDRGGSGGGARDDCA